MAIQPPVTQAVVSASNPATTSGTPTVAGFATALNPAPATASGISGFTAHVRNGRSV